MKRHLLKGAVLGAAISLIALPAAAQIGATVKAGFEGLPLRTCEGVTAGVIKELKKGQALKILWDNKDNWAEVEVVGTGEKGWVNLENTTK